MFRGPNTPLTMAEYLAPNTPMVSVHIAVYDTTTLIGMTAPHMAFDISGAKEFFAIWVASLDNALDSIAEAPRTYSPMVEIAASRQARGEDLTDTSPPREWGAFTVLGTLAYLIGAILRRLFEGPEETKMIYVPLEWLAERKSETLVELQTQSPSEWLGTNDILMAFVVKVASSILSRPQLTQLSDGIRRADRQRAGSPFNPTEPSAPPSIGIQTHISAQWA